MGSPGKTAPLLLQNLLTYDARHEKAAGRNLLTSPPPQHNPKDTPRQSVSSRNCRHELQLKEEQSAPPQKGVDPDHTTIYKIATYCQKCRWHFDIVVDFRDDGPQNSPCKKANSDYPLHHFLFKGEEDEHRLDSLGGQNKPRTCNFSCSAPKCPVVLRIRISPPRFTDLDIHLLTDKGNLRRRWERSKELNGNRADTDMARPIDAPDFLNTYLHDSLNPKLGKRRIPLLNRKFLKTFGVDCDDILIKLGFSRSVEVEEDGSSAEVWYLPQPSPSQDPLESLEPTSRNIVEDARYELNAIILQYSEIERSSARRNPMILMPARSYIELALGCDDYELRVGGSRETRSSTHEEDHPYYAGLGSLADFADPLLLFAFNRQVEVDPQNTPYYFECLQDLAVGRKSDALQSDVAILASQGLFTREEVLSAYRVLGIDPAHAHALSDEIITNQFRSRLSDIGPNQVEESRKALRVIGNARNSEGIKREASSSIETYEQALAWLDLEDNETSTDDFVISMVALKANDDPLNNETARKAVKLIADHRRSQRLWSWLETGNMEVAEMDNAEAYATLNITDRSSKLDLGILQSHVASMIESDPGNADRLRIAHEKVRQDQESTFGKSWDDSIRPTVNYPLETWPDLSSEALEPKRVGRTAVSRARAETGQQFVRELQSLFQHMINAPSHNIRPERSLAALALTRGESTDISVDANNNGNSTTAVSGLGMIGDLPVSGPMLPPGFQTSRPPTPADSVMGDHNDAAGDADSMKAMDLTAATDEPNKLEDVAQQQDAAEILNNVFDLLSCAFKGESTLRDGEQQDFIKRLFFSDVTTVRKTKDKDIPKTDLQDNVLVSTKGRDRALCAALDDEFGLTELEDGVTKYEYFEEAAPIQIINVRRLQFENGQPRKDESHLALDKIMYLDRYLKKTKSLSEDQLQDLRHQQWQLQSELRSLECRKRLLKETDFKNVDLPGVLDETACLVKSLDAQLPEFKSAPPQTDLEIGDINSFPREEVSNHLNQRADELRPELTEIHARMDNLESQIDSVFENCKDHPYRLHAIFMHAGSHRGGHYWIYIYDFQNDIWRKYNDETVTEESEEMILKRIQQDRPPTSTGIVYVREDVTEYTEAVCRRPQVNSPQNQHGDVEMTDAQSIVNMDIDYKNLEIIHGVEQ
ncbi:ubiquitin-specific protease ubp2 [Kalmusia sp. IMI 367209]|nr:ubiquitin-specific protease ubp2 [Kalmusia sp. IMI 367209]